ncbi:MAG TPA: HlyD family secretion protein, partial [Armatimonadota bacterium]|nr:HlyD family secretion protein [Armatimonadota bacterium]
EHVAVSAGQELAEGEAIATLRQLNPVWAEVTLAPNAVNRVHRKQKVTLSIPSSERIAAVGEIASMAPRSTHRESPWTVKVVFPNPQHQLLPGAEVQLTFR